MKLSLAIMILSLVLISGCTQTVNSASAILNPNQCPLEDELRTCISNSAKNGSVAYWGDYIFTLSCNLTENYTFHPQDINCKKGSAKGENINYWYCRYILYASFSKTVISPEGIIQGELHHTITKIVLNSTSMDAVQIECEN